MSTSSRCKSIRAPERQQGSIEKGHAQDGWPLLIHTQPQPQPQPTTHTTHTTPKSGTDNASALLHRQKSGRIQRRFCRELVLSCGSTLIHVARGAHTAMAIPQAGHHQVWSLRIVPDHTQGNCICSVHVLSFSLNFFWSYSCLSSRTLYSAVL
jgi:hypothetical protein